jgi:DNA-nicking Smr family endonuclease
MQQDEERLLFLNEMAGVQPLRKHRPVGALRIAPLTPGQLYRREAAVRVEERDRDVLSLCLKKQVRPDDWLSFKRGGVQNGVFKKLRQGRYPVEATLDLHQSMPERARDELAAFISDCMAHDIRTALINHGRICGGARGRALIKSYVAQWLPELEEIMAFHTAQKPDGGDKAVYVLLRKSERRKQENRERYGGRQTV